MTDTQETLSLVNRLKSICTRRQEIIGQIEALRQSMPNWTMEPMRLAGLSNQELGRLLGDLERVESETGIRELEETIDVLDAEIDKLESQIMISSAPSMDSIESLLSLICERVQNNVVCDPEDVFYDHGDARLLALLKRVHEDVRSVRSKSPRNESRPNGDCAHSMHRRPNSSINYIEANISVETDDSRLDKTG